MATSLPRPSTPTVLPNPGRTLTIRRIRFGSEAAAGARVRRRFTQPRQVLATEEAGEPADLTAPKPWPEATNRCDVVYLNGSSSADLPKNVQDWLAPPAEQPEAVRAVVIAGKEETLHWRPGQVVVQGRPDRLEDTLAAVTDFAFYEGELRALEATIEAHEAQAQLDAGLAHRIRRCTRQERQRFEQLITFFAGLRLTYARLEPRLVRSSRALTPEARRLMARLLKKADVEDRLEAVSNRLEALEDLYEGANDRVADFRWYRNGHLLEIGILAMLLIEAVLMVVDIGIHYREYQVEARSAAVGEEKSATDLSEEFEATLTKIGDGQVSFTRTEEVAEQTLPLAANVNVNKGRIDRNTEEVETGKIIPGGLKNELFAKVNDKGVHVTIVTDRTNTKIAEILVMPAGKRR
jgi:hypothetical protein